MFCWQDAERVGSVGAAAEFVEGVCCRLRCVCARCDFMEKHCFRCSVVRMFNFFPSFAVNRRNPRKAQINHRLHPEPPTPPHPPDSSSAAALDCERPLWRNSSASTQKTQAATPERYFEAVLLDDCRYFLHPSRSHESTQTARVCRASEF